MQAAAPHTFDGEGCGLTRTKARRCVVRRGAASSKGHPMRRDVVVQGSTARAITAAGKLDTTQNHRTVKEAYEAEAELGRAQDPNEQHVCGLCGEWLPWEAFKVHAPLCIQLRIPRAKVWAPGVLPVQAKDRKYGEVG